MPVTLISLATHLVAFVLLMGALDGGGWGGSGSGGAPRRGLVHAVGDEEYGPAAAAPANNRPGGNVQLRESLESSARETRRSRQRKYDSASSSSFGDPRGGGGLAAGARGGGGAAPGQAMSPYRYVTDEAAMLRDAKRSYNGEGGSRFASKNRLSSMPDARDMSSRHALRVQNMAASEAQRNSMVSEVRANRSSMGRNASNGKWRQRIMKRANQFVGRAMATMSKKGKNVTTCIGTLLSEDMTDGWFANFTAAAHRLNRGGSVVLTGGDWNYRGVLMNWMAMMDRINVTEYIVFCYDERLLSIVGAWESGGHGILTPNCTSIQEFMFLKLVGVNALIHAGYTATWSDCDCVWLRPFLDEWVLPHGSSYDVVGQRALHPRSISNITGAVLCTGLFTVFPTERSFMLFEIALDFVTKSKEISDQLVLNEALWNAGSYGEASTRMVYHHRDTIQSPDCHNASAPRLGLLPYEPFPRTPNGMTYLRQSLNASMIPYVYHVRSAKVGNAKVAQMSSLRMWSLRASWSVAKTRADFRRSVDMSMVLIPPWDEALVRKRGLVRRNALRVKVADKDVQKPDPVSTAEK